MQKSQLIDSHCHLDFKAFDNDRAEVLQRALDQNISDIVIPGTEKKHWDRVRILSESSPNLHACYGIHPYWVDQHDKQDISELENYIGMHRPVAVGECGLDFRPHQADKQTQSAFFEAQLAIADNQRLPVVIHSVKATEPVTQCIKKFKNLSGMIHSFSGSMEQAQQLIALNFMISISASVTFDNAKKTRAVASSIPLTSLLLETDAPDQPDQEHRNERNEPAYIINTLKAIAEIRNDSPEAIARQTSINARRLFNL
jgi:TatD DNase family protein